MSAASYAHAIKAPSSESIGDIVFSMAGRWPEPGITGLLPVPPRYRPGQGGAHQPLPTIPETVGIATAAPVAGMLIGKLVTR